MGRGNQLSFRGVGDSPVSKEAPRNNRRVDVASRNSIISIAPILASGFCRDRGNGVKKGGFAGDVPLERPGESTDSKACGVTFRAV